MRASRNFKEFLPAGVVDLPQFPPQSLGFSSNQAGDPHFSIELARNSRLQLLSGQPLPDGPHGISAGTGSFERRQSRAERDPLLVVNIEKSGPEKPIVGIIVDAPTLVL